MNVRRRNHGWHAAALLAVLMLSFATVRSVVMQAAMSLQDDLAPMCLGNPGDEAADSSMAGMDMGQAGTADPASRDHRPDGVHGDKARCPYCAAAAHPPIPGHATPLPHVVDFVFAPFRVVASQGPRGPPAREPRARGPPPDSPAA